jgi:hypothetical protein
MELKGLKWRGKGKSNNQHVTWFAAAGKIRETGAGPGLA